MTEDSKAAGQSEYKRVIIAFHDLADCRLYLNRLTGRNGETPPARDDHAQRNALMTAIIVSYARPFSGNRAAKDVARRVPATFLETLNSEQVTLHNRVLRMRNREFAHSDPEVSEVRVTWAHSLAANASQCRCQMSLGRGSAARNSINWMVCAPNFMSTFTTRCFCSRRTSSLETLLNRRQLPPNPRMQPTGRRGAGRCAGGTLLSAAKEAKVCAGAGTIARS